MGRLKERQQTIITAKLIQWEQLDLFKFNGIVANSIDDFYVDNFWITIEFQSVTKYDEFNGHWKNHLLGYTRGKYILMNYADQRRANQRD